jgi:Flp pilus assembly protein TadG
MFQVILRFLSSFRRDEEGSLTVEYVLWVCYLVGLVCLSADGTMLMHQKSVLYDAARDASRQVALGLKSESDAERAVLARFGNDPAYGVSVTTQNGYVTSQVTLPFRSATIFGDNFTGDAQLAAQSIMWIEVSGS